jgi:hypothetical protein
MPEVDLYSLSSFFFTASKCLQARTGINEAVSYSASYRVRSRRSDMRVSTRRHRAHSLYVLASLVLVTLMVALEGHPVRLLAALVERDQQVGAVVPVANR